MANDLYARNVQYGDAFESDKVKINFSGFSRGLLGQSIQVTYAQVLNRIWELGSNKTYLIAGRTSGNAAFQAITGPAAATKVFIRKYGNVCNANSNTLNFSYTGAWCGGGGSNESTALHNVVIQSASLQAAAQDMLLSQSVAAMFVSMT